MPTKPSIDLPSPKLRLIKNGHTAQEMAASGEQWATHEGPYLTLEEVLAIEATKEKQ